MTVKLGELGIEGFKTIRSLEFAPRQLNVLIGANGAGKSNLISFFRLLSWLAAGDLQGYVGRQGGAHTLLMGGPARTPEIQARLSLQTAQGRNDYQFRLAHAPGDTLIFVDERCRFLPNGISDGPWMQFRSNQAEATLTANAHDTPRAIKTLLRKVVVHQFHNTSPTARLRGKWRVDDGRWLKEDAGNLAAFLLRLREHEHAYYRRIVDTLQLLLPFFVDFELEPEAGSVLLRWRERGNDAWLDAGQAADGMLRLMALVALLLQPEQDLPAVLILDEPELGLHPYAIKIVAGLVVAAAQHAQVLIATQSLALLDECAPEDVLVVERHDGASEYRRLASDRLQEWLQDYSLAQLFEKNVLGGHPSR